MKGDVQAPTGLARRGRRLSDRETEQRMLRAAMAMVRSTGLTVSLDHISFEDVIREADVSRSAVYRRWPYKDLFFSDLVKQLATDATPGIVEDELKLMQLIVTENLDRISTPEGRQHLITELFRRLSLLDFQTMYDSPGWRTYIALHATFMSLSSGALRDQVQVALAESERTHNARIGHAWRELTGLFGYRLKPGHGVTFESLATLLSATMRGLVIMALATPEMAAQRVQASPFDARADEEWSLPALGLGAVASAFLEPDPGISWDGERLAAIRSVRQTWAPPSSAT